jgi:cyclophilin family peptidyl-prolyl cis-trans isomerase
MNNPLSKLYIPLILLLTISCTSNQNNEYSTVLIKTTSGDIKIKLYDDTPKHRDNFIRLVNSGFYNDITFHRVIKDFMIQTGDPQFKSLNGTDLADSLRSYTIPSEILSKYYHKKGAVAAARQGNDINPFMRSSGTQFYIVEGTKYAESELNIAEQQINNNIKQVRFSQYIREVSDSLNATGKTVNPSQIEEIASSKMLSFLMTYQNYHISREQRDSYIKAGGTPRLDATYTVFGEVIEGLNVVDNISSVSTDSHDKPFNDIKIINMKILKK